MILPSELHKRKEPISLAQGNLLDRSQMEGRLAVDAARLTRIRNVKPGADPSDSGCGRHLEVRGPREAVNLPLSPTGFRPRNYGTSFEFSCLGPLNLPQPLTDSGQSWGATASGDRVRRHGTPSRTPRKTKIPKSGEMPARRGPVGAAILSNHCRENEPDIRAGSACRVSSKRRHG
jgi:hypothetical protein